MRGYPGDFTEIGGGAGGAGGSPGGSPKIPHGISSSSSRSGGRINLTDDGPDENGRPDAVDMDVVDGGGEGNAVIGSG